MGLFDFLKKKKTDINEAVANLANDPSAVLIDVRELFADASENPLAKEIFDEISDCYE